MRKRIQSFVLILLLLPCAMPSAQTDYGTLGVAAPWLQAGGNARSRALAATVAAPEASGGLNDNVAGLALKPGWQLGLGHVLGIQGGSQEHGALVWSNGKNGVGLGVDYLGFGAVDGYAVSNGQLTRADNFNPYAFGANVAWAGQWQEVGVGLAGKWVSQSLNGSSSAGTFAGDLGLLWAPPQGLGFGFTLQNVGGNLEKGKLPALAKGGLVLRMNQASMPLLLAMDYTQSLAAGDLSANQEAVGAEFWPHKALALRLGYTMAERGSLGGGAGLSAGLGAKVGMFTVDYAYATLGELGAEQSLALEVGW